MFLQKILIFSCTIIVYIIKKKTFLQVISTQEISNRLITDWFEMNGKQRLIMPKKASTLNSKVNKKI